MRFYLSLFLVAGFVASAVHGAELRECEKAKLQQLRQSEKAHSAAPAKSRKKSKSNRSASVRSIDEIETWLWKNCREYSYELRALEQQRM
jgi:hypothetical protein